MRSLGPGVSAGTRSHQGTPSTFSACSSVARTLIQHRPRPWLRLCPPLKPSTSGWRRWSRCPRSSGTWWWCGPCALTGLWGTPRFVSSSPWPWLTLRWARWSSPSPSPSASDWRRTSTAACWSPARCSSSRKVPSWRCWPSPSTATWEWKYPWGRPKGEFL